MAKTRALVQRRKAIRNIRKITRTMELIATAKYKKAYDRAIEAAAFTRKITELAEDLSASATNISHPLLEKREKVKTSLLLVISSNRGLCGGYDAVILREAISALRKMQSEGVTPILELSGKRAITAFRSQATKPAQTYTHFEDKPRFEEVDVLASRYLKDYIAGRIDQVQVAYMKFLSAGRQEATLDTLLPLSSITQQPTLTGRAAVAGGVTETREPVEYEFLPDAKNILEELLPVSFKVRLFKCFLDAAVSEQIARRVTMKAATENADQMIKNLTRLYNRARQAQITKEIAEVIAGAEALK
jgi:F-type H+-transporting ATPase subunit gamma